MKPRKNNIIKAFFIFLFVLFVSCTANSSHNTAINNEIINSLNLNKDIKKLIFVKSYDISFADVVMLERTNDVWQKVDNFKGRVGRNGVALHNQKREGDGKTPAGLYALKNGFGLIEIETQIPYIKLKGNEYWVDDNNSKFYNTMQFLKSGTIPSWKSAEHLSAVSPEYEYAIVIDYNNPPVKEKGSAIFLHVENNKATSGCVSVPKEKMEKILKWVDNKSMIYIY